MAGTLTPPFTIPDITDPAATANAALGYSEFQNLKNYLLSLFSQQFDPTNGLFLSTVQIPYTAIPLLATDLSNTVGATGNQIKVVGLNGTPLSSFATNGLIYWTQSTGVPSIATLAQVPTAITTLGDLVVGNSSGQQSRLAGNSTTTPKLLMQTGTGSASATPAWTATSQLPGSATNDSASAGNIGECIQSLVASGSAIALTTNTQTNITSVTLTAGDWDVEGNVSVLASGSSAITQIAGGLNNTSATLPTDGSECYGSPSTGTSYRTGVTMPRKRFSLASGATIYLVTNTQYSSGTITAYGAIVARRAR